MSLVSGYAYLRSTNLAPYLPVAEVELLGRIRRGKAFVHIGGSTVGRRWADAAHGRQMSGYTVATCRIMVPYAKLERIYDPGQSFRPPLRCGAGYTIAGVVERPRAGSRSVSRMAGGNPKLRPMVISADDGALALALPPAFHMVGAGQ
jgi:hypothetical protein